MSRWWHFKNVFELVVEEIVKWCSKELVGCEGKWGKSGENYSEIV